MPDSAAAFRSARDLLFELRTDYDAAYAHFAWPQLDSFNWALDWFDGVLAAEHPDAVALWVVRDQPEGFADIRLTFAELTVRSNRVANWLRSAGIARGDRLVLMLGNRVELWETLLAAIKLGVVVIPATTLLSTADLVDRVERGGARHVVVAAGDTGKFDGVPGGYTRIAVGEPVDGWLSYADADGVPETFVADGGTRASDPLLLYFTSGTTAQPKLVEHTHASYPAGHLSTMYWIGLRPGDVHLNISSPGWAKHAWSNMFAPWNAGATVLVYDYARMDARRLIQLLERCEVTTFCAPPTVWRMLIQSEFGTRPSRLRELVAAGEPLNPEVIAQVRSRWGIVVRDGYGQTETTAQIGNTPDATVRVGSMGRPLPGYTVTLVDPATGEIGDTGEICLELAARPLGLMTGYRDSQERTTEAMRDGFYHTGDVAGRDADGYITYIGRSDDVFKTSDYRISPFELESVLLEHEAVAEAAVVPAPDALRLSVPKAYVLLAAGYEPSAETAFAILKYARQALAPYKRIRRIEFAELPKTISGKIRRVELREAEDQRSSGARHAGEYRDEDFPELKSDG
jgi:acetyl-CoA synthetase